MSENYIEIEIGNPKGDYEVHKADLENKSMAWTKKIHIEVEDDYSKVRIIAETEESLNEFKSWIDDSRSYYMKNFVDASMEVNSANQIIDEIWRIENQ